MKRDATKGREVRSFLHPELARVELRSEGGQTKIVGAATLFNRFSQNLGGWVEQIDPHAFDRVLSPEHDTMALFNHDASQVLGRTLSHTLRLWTDATGLRYEITIPDTSAGRDLAELVRRGDITGSSFSFTVAPDGGYEWGTTPEGFPLGTVKAVTRLYDVGPVTYPAYLSTHEAGASVALRSLAAKLHRPLDEITAAAASNELAALMRSIEDNTYPLKPHQIALYNAVEKIAEDYGKFAQGTGGDGAHYAPESPFAAEGLVCSSCMFYAGPAACEVVAGEIAPNGICKLWQIPEALLSLGPGTREQPAGHPAQLQAARLHLEARRFPRTPRSNP